MDRMDRMDRMEKENLSRQEPRQPHGAALTSVRMVRQEGIHCPICLLPTGRRMRGKIYCGNCGFIES